ncbi:hypothetical protein [Micromonospora sp. NPDC005220]|uniref:hypothetical protein n=1 Tax=Micromonospora sp. NPDC005220 TaxID=3155589 RepID=UPI0033AB3934
MAKPTNRSIVTSMLEVAGSDDTEPADAAVYRQQALVYALLGLADEVRDLREAISGVEGALEDQDGHGVGTHARHISDWLERISKK